MGSLKAIVFVVSVFLLYIESSHAASTPMPGSGTTSGMMEDWKIVAIVVPCVIGGLAVLLCLICCCCCQGGAAGGMMCCDPNYGCGPMCDPNCCGPMCDCNACCGPMCDPAMCCGPHCCDPNCCGPQCCGPQCCDPNCCGPQCCDPNCCGPCCYVQPVAHAPVVTQYATRGQIWPQQACNYRSAPPGAVTSSQTVTSVPVNGGMYGRSMDGAYGSAPMYGGGGQCAPCGQQPMGGGGGYRY